MDNQNYLMVEFSNDLHTIHSASLTIKLCHFEWRITVNPPPIFKKLASWTQHEKLSLYTKFLQNLRHKSEKVIFSGLVDMELPSC